MHDSHLHISMAVVGDDYRRLRIHKENKMKAATLREHSAGQENFLHATQISDSLQCCKGTF